MTAVNEPAAAGAHATPHAPANPNSQPSCPLGIAYLSLLPSAMPIGSVANFEPGTYANGSPVAKALTHSGPKPREEDLQC